MTADRKTVCREGCGSSVQEVPCIKFAFRTIKGGAYICLPCAMKWMTEHHVHGMAEFVPAYLKAHTDPGLVLKRELEDAQARIKYLEALLDERTRPEERYK